MGNMSVLGNKKKDKNKYMIIMCLPNNSNNHSRQHHLHSKTTMTTTISMIRIQTIHTLGCKFQTWPPHSSHNIYSSSHKLCMS